MKNTIYFDGGTKNNEICIYDSTKDEYIIKKMSNKKYTSNELEYCAFIHAIRYVKKSFYNIKELIFVGDSKLVINQVRNTWQMKSMNMKILQEQVKLELEEWGCTRTWIKNHVIWVPREKNYAGHELDRRKKVA